jgi:hypothetical protein
MSFLQSLARTLLRYHPLGACIPREVLMNWQKRVTQKLRFPKIKPKSLVKHRRQFHLKLLWSHNLPFLNLQHWSRTSLFMT